MFVSAHRKVTDTQLRTRLWELYVLGFAEQLERTPYEEMLSRSEFNEIVGFGAGRTYICWDGIDPVGIVLLTADIEGTPWINHSYVEAKYGAKARVYYIAGAVTRASYRDSGAMAMMLKCLGDLSATEKATIIFDFCETNRDGSADTRAKVVKRLASTVTDAYLEPIGVQRFYAISAVGSRKADIDFLVDTDAVINLDGTQISGTLY